MNRDTRIAYTLFIFCTVLFVFGCPKKALEPVITEIPRPQQPEQFQQQAPGIDQPSMTMDSMGSSESGDKLSGKYIMDKASAEFENADIHFEYDSFGLNEQAKKILADKAGFLNSKKRIKVRIEGYCDERGTADYNIALGERRAKAAQDYLVFLGIGQERLSTVSYGEENPIDPAHNEAAWVKNRRAHFVILGE